jgi:hypothetical protein
MVVLRFYRLLLSFYAKVPLIFEVSEVKKAIKMMNKDDFSLFFCSEFISSLRLTQQFRPPPPNIRETHTTDYIGQWLSCHKVIQLTNGARY